MRYHVDGWREAGALSDTVATSVSTGSSVVSTGSSVVSTGTGLYGFIAANASDPGGRALQVAADAQGTLDARLMAASSPQAQASILVNGTSGIDAAISGQPLTDAQVQSGFALACSGVLIVAGVGATAALAVMAPIAAVVFGGGYLIGQGIQKALGIRNQGAIACGPGDETHYAADPTQPGWIRAPKPGDLIGSPWGKWPITNFTDGPFERWSRPVIKVAYELGSNCKLIPGAKTWRDFANGLLQVWNSAAPAGSPTRTIPYVMEQCVADPRYTYGSTFQAQCYAQANDLVQLFMQDAFSVQYPTLDRTAPVAGEAAHPWVLQVADPPQGPPPEPQYLPGLGLRLIAPVRQALITPATLDRATRSKIVSSSTISPVVVAGAAIGTLALLKPSLLRATLRKIGIR